jgi:hypothetical protein
LVSGPERRSPAFKKDTAFGADIDGDPAVAFLSKTLESTTNIVI